ncbi:MAG: hypothetical protein LBJ32_04295 [Oscillospiraceae bacterium]|jgi:hypothetical protein|nr:hypothetical protein [Oscillospiraceae bacterium]
MLTKENSTEVFKFSAEGTLAHSKNGFVLKTFAESTLNSENFDFETLGGKDLKLIAGGSKNTKNLAVSLAFIIAGTMLTNVPSASASMVDSIKNKASSATQKKKSEAKEFYKKRSTLSKVGVGIGATILGIGTIALGGRAVGEFYLRDVTTKIDDMSDKQVETELKRQIDIFSNRDRNVFKVDDTLMKKMNPRLFLLLLLKLNDIFEKYSLFTRTLTQNKRIRNETFSLRINKSFSGLQKIKYFGEADLSGITFNELYAPFLKIVFIIGKQSINNSGFLPPKELNQIAEYWIAHQIGHVFQFLIRATNNCSKSAVDMKEDVIRIAMERYGGTTRKISGYGETDEFEWWAEAFAYVQCRNNLNPLGLAMKDYLNELRTNTLIF